jgi:hypothetical protein
MTTPRSPYDNVVLDQQTRSIRLIRILETSRTDHIKCELRAFDLSSCCPYTALSYTWGPENPTYNVTVGGIPMPSRENLWHFLREMSLASEHGWFWIDAICIDQSNIEERNHQVQMMRLIYSQVSCAARDGFRRGA